MDIKGNTAKQVITEARRVIGVARFKTLCNEITCAIAAGSVTKPQDAYNAFTFHGVYGSAVFRMITHFWPSLSS